MTSRAVLDESGLRLRLDWRGVVLGLSARDVRIASDEIVSIRGVTAAEARRLLRFRLAGTAVPGWWLMGWFSRSTRDGRWAWVWITPRRRLVSIETSRRRRSLVIVPLDWLPVDRSRTYQTPGLGVRENEAIGRYVVAERTIEPGEIVARWGGRMITTEEATRLSRREQEYLLQIDDDRFLHVGPGELTTADYISHSCDPNCGFVDDFTIAAMRRIDLGETVSFDYAMSDSNPFVAFECRCGTDPCRGRLASDDWRIPELQRRYAGWFAPHIRRRIDDTA